MGMNVKIDCPYCGYMYETIVSGKGKHARKCPKCEKTFMMESKQKQPGQMNRKSRRDMKKKLKKISKKNSVLASTIETNKKEGEQQIDNIHQSEELSIENSFQEK